MLRQIQAYSEIIQTYSGPCKNLAYLEHWQFENQKHIQNSGKFRTRGIFRNLVYSKSWHTKNPNVFKILVYWEPRYIQNCGMFSIWNIFKTLAYHISMIGVEGSTIDNSMITSDEVIHEQKLFQQELLQQIKLFANFYVNCLFINLPWHYWWGAKRPLSLSVFFCNFYKCRNLPPKLSDFLRFSSFCHTGVKFQGHT